MPASMSLDRVARAPSAAGGLRGGQAEKLAVAQPGLAARTLCRLALRQPIAGAHAAVVLPAVKAALEELGVGSRKRKSREAELPTQSPRERPKTTRKSPSRENEPNLEELLAVDAAVLGQQDSDTVEAPKSRFLRPRVSKSRLQQRRARRCYALPAAVAPAAISRRQFRRESARAVCIRNAFGQTCWQVQARIWPLPVHKRAADEPLPLSVASRKMVSSTAGPDGDTKISKPAPKLRKSRQIPRRKLDDLNDDVCAVCENGGDLICCEGRCFQSFHLECLQMTDIPDTFVCDICKRSADTGEETCFQCNKMCRVTEKNGGAVRCKEPGCGKFFHRGECAKRNNVHYDPKNFICSRHVCTKCPTVGQNEPLLQCVRCPVAFHVPCIPAGCSSIGRNMICPSHHDRPKPSWNTDCCIVCRDGGELICCDTCIGSYHASCINEIEGFQRVPDGPWSCPTASTVCSPAAATWFGCRIRRRARERPCRFGRARSSRMTRRRRGWDGPKPLASW